MKRHIFFLLIFFPFIVGAQIKNENIEVFDLGNFKLHIYTSTQAMADVSAIIEGKTEIIILEQPSFYKSIEEFNEYTKGLGKPITKVIADYHMGGLADYSGDKIVMIEGMPEFEKGQIYNNMMLHFADIFGGMMDVRPHQKAEMIVSPNSTHTWAGLDFVFSSGSKSDFPASSIMIGNKVYYSHFAPVKAHFNTLQINNRASIDAVLNELNHAKLTGCELFFGSHGTPASIDIVDFQIEYLRYMKELLNDCENSDVFGQRLIAAYPDLKGASDIRALSKVLYPDEPVNKENEEIKTLLSNYLKSISNLDRTLAKSVWADVDEISVINGVGQFFGFNSIFDDFIFKYFSPLSERKLSSLSEVVNIYGNMAYVQFYWAFDIKDKDGKAEQRYGRETLICHKVNNKWKIYHIHYSGMPKGLI